MFTITKNVMVEIGQKKIRSKITKKKLLTLHTISHT